MNLNGESFRKRLLPIACSQAVGVACGVVGVKVVSKLVEPAVLGVYGIFLSFATVGIWFVHAGVIRYVSRNWASADDKNRIWAAARRAWAKKTGWLFLCAVLIGLLVCRGRPGSLAAFVLPLAVAASLLSLGTLAQTALQAERNHWRDLVISSVGSLTRTFVPPVLYFFSGGIVALYTGYSIHALCLAGVGLWILRARGVGHASASGAALEAIYDGPLFSVLALANWMLTGATRWIVAWRFGSETAGQFTLAGNIALIIPAVLGAIFLQYCQPGFFSIVDSGEPGARLRLGRYVDRVVLLLGTASLAGLAALRFVSPWLVGWLIDEKYVRALDWIIPAGCFGLAVIMAQFYHVMMVAIRRERACAPVDLGTAAFLLLGGVAAAWQGPVFFQRALLASPLVILLLTRLLARRYLVDAPVNPGPDPRANR